MGRTSNVPIMNKCFFWLQAYSAVIKTAVWKISRRTLIPINPLRRGLATKKHKSEISRKRNLPLKLV
jgi:hypothetical protein